MPINPYFDWTKYQQQMNPSSGVGNTMLEQLQQGLTDYSNTQRAATANPFSALFPYEEFKQEEEQRNAKKQLAENRIAKTNAIADAFRVLAQGIGGAFGATIPQNGPNNNILQAYNRALAMDEESRRRLDNWRMFDLNNQLRGLQYNLGLEAEARQRDFQQQQAQLGRDFQRDMQEDQQQFSMGMKQGEQKWQSEEQRRREKAEMEQIKERNASQERIYANWRNPTAVQNAKDTWSFNDPTTGKEVSVDPTTNRNLLYLLDAMYPVGSPERPRELTAVLRGEMVRTPAVEYLIQKNWPTLNTQLEAMKQGQLENEQPKAQQPEEPKDLNRRERAAERRVGDEVKGMTQDQYVIAINNAKNNPKLSYKQKLKAIVDLAIAYEGMSQAEAETQAKALLDPNR